MKLCIPVLEDKGLDSRVSEHFGSSSFFLIFDSESNAASLTANSSPQHGHGKCQPMHVLSGYKPHAVVCNGITREELRVTRFANQPWRRRRQKGFIENLN